MGTFVIVSTFIIFIGVMIYSTYEFTSKQV